MTVETTHTATKTCANCGAEVSESARFCPNCGHSVQALPPAEQPSSSAEVTTPTAVAATPVPPAAASVARGLLPRAKQNDRDAIETMFKQFLPQGEQVSAAEYLGVYGFWGFGRESFGVATDRRIASLQVGVFGHVLYSEGSLEYVNSTVLYQPSRIGLYVTVGVVGVFTLGIGLLLAPIIARWYYRRKKAGLVFVVREGVSVHIFIDRKRMAAANRFHREIARLREDRIRRVGAI